MGRRAVLADTGPLFAAVDPKDQYHRRTQRDLARFERDGRRVIGPYPILWECHALLVRRRPRPIASSWLADIQSRAILLDPIPQDYRAAMEIPFRYPDQSITLFDAILAVLSDRLALPVSTFDHHFDVMGSDVWR